ncbi:DUF805 domain-containing protein [Nioella nitratireducens]|uniref:DUF805 domain-containing protein n=1 Tax=Nioella nitratireducens TaxID=1287720 RepID=UPI0008FD6203|nr:DUF805 domain-containing protein [Nioella nitratireducens]
MGFFAAIKSCYAKTLTFSGRARRSEYWWFVVFQMLFGFALTAGFVVYMMQMPVVLGTIKATGLPPVEYWTPILVYLGIQFVFIVLPSLSVSVRRLHDTDHSGFWYFINAVPLIGPIWFFVLMCLPGTAGRNSFGPDPIGRRRNGYDTHPALMGDLDPEIKDALRERHKAEIAAYYKSRVLPTIQQNKTARGT